MDIAYFRPPPICQERLRQECREPPGRAGLEVEASTGLLFLTPLASSPVWQITYSFKILGHSNDNCV